jgi:hypothetical protein
VKYIPEWFPGAGFKKLARMWAESLLKAIQDPYDFTKARIVSAVRIMVLAMLTTREIRQMAQHLHQWLEGYWTTQT